MPDRPVGSDNMDCEADWNNWDCTYPECECEELSEWGRIDNDFEMWTLLELEEDLEEDNDE